MLNAILCVWNEEDIIYSTVKHALAQGCAHVYIIDNDSTDQTVAEAVKAGAKHYGSFSTDVFDEVMKTVNINKAAVELTKYSPDERNWWLYIDADEFPGFDTGKTIAETLSCLPDDVRAVGGYLHDHLPTHAPYHIRGIHPIDCMPVLSKTTSSKYILLRHDKNAPPIYAQSGAHKYNANGGAVVEWDQEIIIHHFNHRQYDVTRNRLEQLIHPDAKGKRRVDWYDAMARLDNKERSMYHGRLERLDKLYANSNHVNLKNQIASV